MAGRARLASVGIAKAVAAILTLGLAVEGLVAQLRVAGLEEQVLTVRGFDGEGRALGDASGFAAGSGFVVTSADMLRRAATIIVTRPGEARQLAGEVRSLDERSGVAILQVTGLTVAGMAFALAAPPGTGAGDIVHVPRFGGDGRLNDELVRGVISEVRREEPDLLGQRSFSVYRHNAVVTAREYGMPMLNDCGQVVGMVRPDPELSPRRLENDRPGPGQLGFGVAGTEVLLALGTLGVGPETAATSCLDAYGVAAREAEAAREREEEAAIARTQAEAAGREAADAREQADAARRQAVDAGERADAAEARANELEGRALASEAEREAARQEAEAARASAEESETAAAALEGRADAAEAAAQQAQGRVAELEQASRLFITAAVAAGIVLILVTATAWRLLSRRRRQLADSEAERKATAARLAGAVMPAGFSCLLEGSDHDGRNIVVKVGAEQLGLAAGAIVGRNPARSGVVLDHPEASREHFRLCLGDAGLSIEDLHSTNGTFVNGKEGAAGQSAVLSPGDEIRLGAAIRLTLSISR